MTPNVLADYGLRLIRLTRVDLADLVNEMLRKDIELIEMAR